VAVLELCPTFDEEVSFSNDKQSKDINIDEQPAAAAEAVVNTAELKKKANNDKKVEC
jgi:cobalamin biosynthesis Mg chelatase CobN